ncbi:MAG: long-chain-fatty-acid--CoA ligase [Gammaproteobacteria bacterium]|nr:long-chain-fatty-acid--CoA ligase [Gammaproteobacteria bacterium]
MHLTQTVTRGALLKANRTALLCSDRSLTWHEFHGRVARLAGVLADLGVTADTGVAMFADTDFPYFEYHYAVPWAGGVMVPLNTRLADPELGYILNDAEVKVLIVDQAYAARVPALLKLAPGVRHVLAIDAGAGSGDALDYETLLAARAPVPDARRGGGDLLAIMYTGGTTGRPKGVMTSHANAVANMLAAIPNMEFHEDMVYLHSMPVFHTAGSARVYGTMMALGTGIVLPRFDMDALFDAVEQHRVTHLLLVPTMINRLLNHPRFARTDFSSLTNISYGASIMPEALLRRALTLLPGVRFTQSYGMTELSPSAAWLQPKYHVLEGPNAGRIKSIGQAIHTAEIRIAGDDDVELPHGEVGEIQVRGPMVMQGYWKQPELTAQTLRGGWMHTGDAAWMDEEGFIYLVDRLKDMIISGGENVYSGEVENALHEHPGVRECAVIGLPDDDFGERVHAIVVPHDGVTLTPEEIVGHCRALIAHYKCPRSVEIRATPLPLSGTNKILKRQLRDEALAQR